MAGLVDAATAIMGGAQRRLEIAARNISNGTTPGYKTVSGIEDGSDVPQVFRANMAQGRMQRTGRALDLAIAGDGLFQVRVGSQLFYTRQGQFSIGRDGAVVTPQGFPLQQAGGGDLMLDRTSAEVAPDGTVIDDGRPVARIAVFAGTDGTAPVPVDGSLFSIAAPEEVADPQLRQAVLESSNTELGGEMVSVMLALREADGGARLVQAYDDLMGRAVTAFGGMGR